MPDCLLMMHNDIPELGNAGSNDDGDRYIGTLQADGNFRGGSAICAGICARKSGAAPTITGDLSGFIRVSAGSLDDVRTLLIGNPVFEAAGTAEIRELPRIDSFSPGLGWVRIAYKCKAQLRSRWTFQF